MTDKKERREYVRVKGEFNVRIAEKKKNDKYEELGIDIGKAIDVSGSGILINIKTPIGIGAVIRIQFLKPNTFDFFEGYGKVVRIEDKSTEKNVSYALGILFHDLLASEKKKLDYYIRLIK